MGALCETDIACPSIHFEHLQEVRMKIVGDRHYKGTAGEQITFRLAPGGVNVGGVTATPGGALPISRAAGSHHAVTITVGFSSNSGGSAEIEVSGTGSVKDRSRIRQINGLANRSAIFVID
jgi:hypothetical protein